MPGSKFVTYAVWFILLGAALRGLFTEDYSVTFAGVGTFLLTLLPAFLGRWVKIDIPPGFAAAVAAFLCATLFLGEVRNFYERYWWWDIVLHTGSAVAFGLVGVILMLILVRGEKLTAAPVTVSFFGFCFAVTIGAAWEIWEFFLDQTFGMNTQKSGLIDTMWDLIVDCLGAAVGAIAGYIHLKGWRGGPLAGMIRDFVERNRRFFGKNTGA
ncbi:MAG TPA: hypothetical protein DDY79_04255 [Brevundimonas sp.]|uniref:hypothetical protein n=1 Tax=Brevundimonas sp. TaxID=1871086 RepID=UPI000E98EAF2|nr:hypothetical protein [Brevundimonas sp.]HBI18533.1 hypothetical protein [Brevundimonas sp.]